MASKKTRVFMGFIAVLFIVTSSATTVAVIWQTVQSNKSNNNQSQVKGAHMENQLAGKPLAGFTPVAHIDQLQEIDTTPGSGQAVKPGATVTVDYTGAVAATGVVF